jgi:hypothetical protein
MARRRVVCISRRMKHEDPHRHISHLGIGGDGGFSEVLMVEEVAAHLAAAEGHRYYVRGGDGWEAEIKLGTCLFCPEPHPFLRSAPDLKGADKLLTLPLCGEP